MDYTCAYWRTARDLDAAQEAKMDLVCRKLSLGPGDRVLDIGCGWGSFARHAAERHGCRVTGITISAAQRAYAVERCKSLPIDIHLLDYRSEDVTRLGPFDKIVSIGMFEHVGKKNYARFGRTVRSLLAPDGLFLLQTIGRRLSTDEIDPFFDKHIFPNGVLPSPTDVVRAMEPSFVLEDWQSAGAHYEKTLLAWHENFERFAKSPTFRLGRRFHRMWRYYLLSFAGAFRARNRHQLWQIVFSPDGVREGYASVR
jgi:cyclopropane-fatty-acyl-phospholipid synthase